MLRATVSGSFRRHMTAIYEAVKELGEHGVTVLSPSDPRIVDAIGEFVFVASDKVRSIKMVEDRHLECIRASDFLWLVAPDGYVGQSASMELGYAIARGVPVFCADVLRDATLGKYVHVVQTIGETLVKACAMCRGTTKPETFLIDPLSTLESVQIRLDLLRTNLRRRVGEIGELEGQAIFAERTDLCEVLAPSRFPIERKIIT